MADASDASIRTVETLIGEGILSAAGALLRKRLGGRRALLVTDVTSHRLFAGALTETLSAAGYAVTPFVMPQGEEQKQPALLSALWHCMTENAFTSADIALALGGGAVGDVTAVACAAYLGGVRCALVPTTLLFQLDGGLNGMFGVNAARKKDALSLRFTPSLLLLDMGALQMLPRERMQDGLAEAIRTAALFDNDLLGLLERTSDDALGKQLGGLVERVLDIKRRVIDGGDSSDTACALSCCAFLAGALQAASDGALTYGRALAAGLCMLTRYTEAVGLTRRGVYARLTGVMSAHGLTAEPPRLDRAVFRDIISGCARGEKRTVRTAYISSIGSYDIIELALETLDSMLA